MGTFFLYYKDRGIAGGRCRFSVAHELGHYYLPEHQEKLMAGHRHGSLAGFVSSAPEEIEADRFAANLLMPSAVFCKAMRDFSASELARLADLFDTSYTSTAHRMVEETGITCSAVFSQNGIVRYAKHSEDLRYRYIYGIRKGSPIPEQSQTVCYMASGGRDKAKAQVQAGLWYKSKRARRDDIDVWEEVVDLGQYGLLTLLVYEPE